MYTLINNEKMVIWIAREWLWDRWDTENSRMLSLGYLTICLWKGK